MYYIYLQDILLARKIKKKEIINVNKDFNTQTATDTK